MNVKPHCVLLAIMAPPVMYQIIYMLRHSSLDIQCIASWFQFCCITKQLLTKAGSLQDEDH